MNSILTYALMTTMFTAASFAGGEDIIIPLDDGSIMIEDAQFIRVNEWGSYVPELAFTITNHTSSSWATIKLQFEIGGLCNGEPRQWSIPALLGLGWFKEKTVSRTYKSTEVPLVDKVNGCGSEVIKAALVLAENARLRIDGVSGERVDLEEQLRLTKARRDAEEAAEAERRAKKAAAEAERRAKKAAAEAKHRKRLAAEREKRAAGERARAAKIRAEREAKAAEERARLRAACSLIYERIGNKMMSDLTVKEAQQVRACEALNLYSP